MKSRMSHLMIGSLTLALIAGSLGGVLGYRKFVSTKQRVPLRVIFEGSASGLHKGGSVNFGGIRVGEVVSLKLDNPRRVVALAMIDNTTPVRKDTLAGLEFQGLTGVAALSLIGANRAAPFFHVVPVFGTVMSIVFLGEHPQVFQFLGFALVLTGVFVASRKPKPG